MAIDLDKLSANWLSLWSDQLIQNPHDFDKKRWIRFHSLPNSERLPESEAEYREVLRRNYKLLASLNPGEDLYVLISKWFRLPDTPKKTEYDVEAIFWRSILENPTTQAYRALFINVKHWRQGQLDSLIRAVADDDAAGVFFFPPDLKWAYHPYDGGMDINFQSTEARDKIKEQYSQWLPDTETGL